MPFALSSGSFRRHGRLVPFRVAPVFFRRTPFQELIPLTSVSLAHSFSSEFAKLSLFMECLRLPGSAIRGFFAGAAEADLLLTSLWSFFFG